MDTTDDIVAVEAEYRSLLNDPRRSLSRFVELSLAYGRMLADEDPQQAAEVYVLALDTLHDPPAEAEAQVALQLVRALRPIAGRVGDTAAELDAVHRERRMLDHGLVEAEPGVRDELCRHAAAVHFAAGDVGAGFMELMDGLRSCAVEGLDSLATDLVLAVRQRHVPDDLIADIENMWVELRRRHFEGNWPLWCLTALGALRLDADDVVTAQMYVRRAESILGHLQRPVAGALVGGWVALAADDFTRAFERFTFASNAASPDVRMRLLAAAGLGESLICLGRFDEARAPLAEAISYDIGDPLSVARCHELLAELAAADGRPGDAYLHLQATRRLEHAARGSALPVERPVPGGVGAASAASAASDLDAVSEATSIVEPAPEPVAALDAEPVGALEAEPALDAGAEAASVSPAEPLVAVPAEAAAFVEPTADPVVDLREEPVDLTPTTPVDLTPSSLVDPVTALVVEGLRTGRFQLRYQPILDTARQRTGAVEAQLVLDVPGHELVGADQLFSAGLERAVAEELCLWTITSACEAAARWHGTGSPLGVVVAVADCQLTPSLPLIVRTALVRTSVRPDRVTIELAGASVGRIESERSDVLDELRALGVRIGVDRFGNGFRSIDTLLRLPVDVVKLDRSVFGAGVPAPLERRMVDTVVALARAFGFEVIASGIDTPAQLDLQEQFGCHGAIGAAVGPAVPASAMFARRDVAESA